MKESDMIEVRVSMSAGQWASIWGDNWGEKSERHPMDVVRDAVVGMISTKAHQAWKVSRGENDKILAEFASRIAEHQDGEQDTSRLIALARYQCLGDEEAMVTWLAYWAAKLKSAAGSKHARMVDELDLLIQEMEEAS